VTTVRVPGKKETSTEPGRENPDGPEKKEKVSQGYEQKKN